MISSSIFNKHIFNIKNGIFQQMTISDALFLIYLRLYPNPSIIIRMSSKYKNNIKFYMDCLAAAFKVVMEQIFHIEIQENIRNFKTMRDQIFYSL